MEIYALETARKGLAQNSLDSVKLLVEDRAKSVPIRVAAIMDLASRALTPEEKVEILLPLLTDYEELIRKTAIIFLGLFNITGVIEKLRSCLSDPSPIVRGETLRSLATLNDETILPTCIDCLMHGQSQDERVYAISALSILNTEAAHRSLEAHWSSTSLQHEERCLLACLLAKYQVRAVESFLEREMLRCSKKGDDSAITWAGALLHFKNPAALLLIKQTLNQPFSDPVKIKLQSLVNDLGIKIDPLLPLENQLLSWVEIQLETRKDRGS